jgi:hypothetical protein
MNSYPIIKVAIFFSGGILFYKVIDINSSVVVISVICFLIFTFLSIRVSKAIPSVIILLTVFLCGYLIMKNARSSDYIFPQDVYRVKNLTVFGRITDIRLSKEKEITFNFETDSLKNETGVLRRNVKLLCKL